LRGGGQTNYSFHVRKRHGGEESESSRGWEPKWRGFCFAFLKWWSCFYFGINYQISYPVDPDVFVWTPIDRNLHLYRPVAMARVKRALFCFECHVLRESFTWQVYHKNYYCLATLTKPVLEFKVILELVFIFSFPSSFDILLFRPAWKIIF